MGVGFLVLPFSCHNTLSPVGKDITTDGTNGNTVDEINAEAFRVVGPTSCFSNTTQEKTSDDTQFT